MGRAVGARHNWNSSSPSLSKIISHTKHPLSDKFTATPTYRFSHEQSGPPKFLNLGLFKASEERDKEHTKSVRYIGWKIGDMQ